MLPIIVCEKNKEAAFATVGIIKKIIESAQIEAQIMHITTHPEQIERLRAEINDVALVIMNVESGVVVCGEISAVLRRNYKSDYFIFITESMNQWPGILRSGIFPADILLSPLSMDDCAEAIGSIYRDYSTRNWRPEFVSFNIGVDIYRIPVEKILYFESFNKKIYIHTINQRLGYYDTLAVIEKRYSARFIRCHNSYLVNKDKIVAIKFSTMSILLDNDKEIPISRTYRPNLQEALV